MNQLTIYRILSFILLPFAALFGFTALFAILAGLANPAILLPGFIMACFTIYVITAFLFLTRGIDANRPVKPGLKDWIKVNGYVTAALAVMSLMNSIALSFYSKEQLTVLATELMAAQPMKPQGMTVESLVLMLGVLSKVIFCFAAILIIHLAINFKLLKKYNHLFGDTTTA